MNKSMNMEYNTTRDHLIIKEYGRHIQRMVDYLLTLDDKEKRQKNANAVIEMMAILNPSLKTVEDYRHKLWDHLFIMSDFKLDVDSPYPKPTREAIFAKPEPLKYPKRYPKYYHLGKHIETVISKALVEEDAEKKQGFANAIGYYMKLTYSTWHKELMQDDTIQSELSTITNGELEFNNRPFVKHRNDPRSDEYVSNSVRPHRKNFGNRGNNPGQGGNRNRNNNNNSNSNRNSRNFKKRY